MVMSYLGRVAERSRRAAAGALLGLPHLCAAGRNPLNRPRRPPPPRPPPPPAPPHPPGLLQDHLQPVQQRRSPLLFHHPPTVLDRVVLAVVRRVVHQPYLQTAPVAELHQPPQPLRPLPPIVGAVVQIDHQPL